MVKKSFVIFLWIASSLFVCAVFLLPETIPLHWNAQWQVDRYGSRYMMLILAVLPLAMYYVMPLLQKIDPRRKNLEKRYKTFQIFRYGLSVLFMILAAVFYYFSWFPQADGYKLLMGIMALALIGLGNYLPKVPQNYFLGIKTPWTLSNEYTWHKTHRIGGYSFMFIGLLMALWSLGNLPYMEIVGVTAIILDVVGLYVYSYWVFRSHS